MSAQGSSDDRATFVRRAWRGGRWVLLAIAIIYIAIVISRVPVVHEERISQETVAKIEVQKLTMSDIDGTRLPPPLDSAQANATIAGVDANGNGIRDDVELAIFAKYPNSEKIRAAELQYAMTEGMFLTEVSDQSTWKAVAEQDDRAFQCITLLNSLKPVSENFYINEIESLVRNTPARKEKFNDVFLKFETSFGLPAGNVCDLNLNELTN